MAAGTRLFCYPARFKIKSKADAEQFYNLVGECDVEVRYEDYDCDHFFQNEKRGVMHYTRHKSERGNIFSPYYQDGDNAEEVMQTIWKNRRFINHQIFAEEG